MLSSSYRIATKLLSKMKKITITITIGEKKFDVNQHGSQIDDVIFIAKFVGKHKDFFTLIVAKKGASGDSLSRKLYLSDANSSKFWATRHNDCTIRTTNIPAFDQCLNSPVGRMIESHHSLFIQ